MKLPNSMPSQVNVRIVELKRFYNLKKPTPVKLLSSKTSLMTKIEIQIRQGHGNRPVKK